MARLDIHAQESDDLAESSLADLKGTQVVEVVLSERNLLALLTKLYIDGSRRTLFNIDTPEGYVLKVVAEDDATHYKSETRNGAPPAGMTPATEAFIEAVKSALETHKQKRKITTIFHKSVRDSRGDEAS